MPEPIDSNIMDSNIPPRKRTMSAAAIAANRANAKRSTGPRTAAGKLRSASNSLQHGLYSLQCVENIVRDHDLTLAITTNLMEQLQPVTPTEHLLTHQIINMQLRFLHMEALYNAAADDTPIDMLFEHAPFLPHVMRQLDRIPGRIQRTLKELYQEQARREQARSCESIPDLPAIPQDPDPRTLRQENDGNEPKSIRLLPAQLHKLFTKRVIEQKEEQLQQALLEAEAMARE